MKNTNKKEVKIDNSRAKRDRVLTGFRNAMGYQQRARALKSIGRMDRVDEQNARG